MAGHGNAVEGQSRLAELVGPFYSRSALLRWLGLTEEGLDGRVREGTLIECVTSDGVPVYPTFQFEDDGEVIAGIGEIMPMFLELGLAGWTLSKWLRVPNPDLPGGVAAVSLLSEGKHVSDVVLAAGRDIDRLAR